jgi:hypothetical protein
MIRTPQIAAALDAAPGACALAATPSSAAAARPRPATRRSRNLIVLRAGDASLHPQWLAGGRRDFDLFISYYGAIEGRHEAESDYYERRPGPKWPCIADLLRENADVVEDYDCVWFPDDDLAVDTATLDRMFAFFHAYGLQLAQPALTPDSYATWNALRQDPACHLRFNRFVEIMAPMFSREALRLCAPTFTESRSGWGLDWLWPVLCRDAGLDRIAVIDATPVCHTRPCGGELYRRNPDLDPRADAERVLRKYGLHEFRGEAKFSFEHRVQDVPLPAARRLVYELRKLNGRRKHRPDA